MQVMEIFVICFVACLFLQAQGLSMDKSKAVPSSRKYVAHGYPITKVPDRDYDDPECSLIGSSVQSTLNDYKAGSEGDTFDQTKAMQKFSACRSSICGSNELRKKLQLRPPLMEELGAVAITFGKTFKPAYKIFKMLADPTFGKILSKLADDEFPIVRYAASGRQRNAVYSIITQVCGNQPQTIKAAMTPLFLTEMFMRTLIPAYIHNVFTGDVYGYILNNVTTTSKLEISWNTAAGQRLTDHPCFDPELIDHSNHVTIENLQYHAKTLQGVNCPTGDGDGDYDYAASYAAPPSDDGPGGDAPPSFNGPNTDGPPSGWSTDTFAP